MITGLLAGLFWAMDTFILSLGVSSSLFSLVYTFIHDFFSSIYLLFFHRKGTLSSFQALKSKKGKLLIVSSLLGGPIGMSAYVYSVYSIGIAYTSMISSLFPALGCLLAFLFLKEKMNKKQVIGLILCIFSVCLLGYGCGNGQISGILSAALCCICWALEGFICSIVMKEGIVTNQMALQIRQCVSFLTYGIVIMNIGHLWNYVLLVLNDWYILAFASFFGTVSYLLYYKAIKDIGVSRAMPLDITYCAWALIFNLMAGQIPSVNEVICGIGIIGGAILVGKENEDK